MTISIQDHVSCLSGLFIPCRYLVTRSWDKNHSDSFQMKILLLGGRRQGTGASRRGPRGLGLPDPRVATAAERARRSLLFRVILFQARPACHHGPWVCGPVGKAAGSVPRGSRAPRRGGRGGRGGLVKPLWSRSYADQISSPRRERGDWVCPASKGCQVGVCLTGASWHVRNPSPEVRCVEEIPGSEVLGLEVVYAGT